MSGKRDRFVMTAISPGGWTQEVTFTMATDDQRSVTSVGCEILARRTSITGWTPLTVDWTYRPDARS